MSEEKNIYKFELENGDILTTENETKLLLSPELLSDNLQKINKYFKTYPVSCSDLECLFYQLDRRTSYGDEYSIWLYKGYSSKKINLVGSGYDNSALITFRNGLDTIKKESKCRYIDISWPHGLEEIRYKDNELMIVKCYGKWGCVSSKENKVIYPCQCDDISLFLEGLSCIKKNGRYGFIDKKGSEIIPCQYEKAKSFHEGLAIVKKDGKYGCINKQGKIVVPFIYDEINFLTNNLFVVEQGGNRFFIDGEGIKKDYQMICSFSKDLTIASIDNKYGFVDKKGNLLSCQYDEIYGFICSSKDLVRVKKNDKYGFANTKGKEIITCQYEEAENFSEGLARVKKNNKYGFIDKTGKEVIPCQYDAIGLYFNEGLVEIWQEDKVGYMNKDGKIVIPCIYDDVSGFNHHIVRVAKDNKQGYLDKLGNEIIPLTPENIWALSSVSKTHEKVFNLVCDLTEQFGPTIAYDLEKGETIKVKNIELNQSKDEFIQTLDKVKQIKK